MATPLIPREISHESEQVTRRYEETVQALQGHRNRNLELNQLLSAAICQKDGPEIDRIVKLVRTEVSELDEKVQKVKADVAARAPQQQLNISTLERLVEQEHESLEKMYVAYFENRLNEIESSVVFLNPDGSEFDIVTPDEAVIDALVSINDDFQRLVPNSSTAFQTIQAKMRVVTSNVLLGIMQEYNWKSKEEFIPPMRDLLSRLHCDEEARAEIITLCSQHHADDAVQFIQGFDITDIGRRVEIAKLFASQTDLLTLHIRKFEIPEESDRFEIFKMCCATCLAHKVFGNFLEIDAFDLADERHRFEIALLSARADGGATMSCLSHFHINNPDFLKEIVVTSLLQKPSPIPALEPLRQCMSIPSAVGKVKETIDVLKSRENPSEWISYAELFMSLVDNPSRSSFLGDFIQAVFDHPDVDQQSDMIRAMYFACTRDAFPLYLQLQEGRTKEAKLLAVFLALLPKEGLPNFQRMLTSLPPYTDSEKQAPLLLETVSQVCQNEKLLAEDKIHLLNLLVSGVPSDPKEKWDEICFRCSLLNAVFENKGEERLTKQNVESHGGTIESLFEGILKELFPSLGSIQNLAKRYVTTFGQFQPSMPLFVCRERLLQTPPVEKTVELLGSIESERHESIDAFEVCVRSILLGTYCSERYDISRSRHLQAVLSNPLLVQEWKTGKEELVTNVLSTLPSIQQEGAHEETFSDFHGWTLIDTDDPQAILQASSEDSGILGDRDKHRWKALAGYLLNGENRLLAVKDRDGSIVARRLLKLLWDPNTRTPVLFLERPYTYDIVSKDILRAMGVFAQQRAAELHLPLLTADEGVVGECQVFEDQLVKDVLRALQEHSQRPYMESSHLPLIKLGEGGASYGTSVESLEGRAPFVFSDASWQGVWPKGIFAIAEPKVFTSNFIIEEKKSK